MQEVRAAVIGTGVMGRKYAQMIAEGKAGALRLTAVVCRSAGAQQWAKDALPDTVRVCPSAEALYDYAEEFDAVLVVTPHKTHPALVMQAFAHGKHVLCDKPSANALAPALEMNRAAEKSGLVFAMMFHQRRYKKYMRLKNYWMMGHWARSSGCSWKTAATSAHGCTTAPAAGVPAGQERAAVRCSIRASTFWTSGSGCSGCQSVFMP